MNKTISHGIQLFISALVLLTVIVPFAFADDPKARAIMEKVDARDDGDNQTSNMEMILIDKRGKQRVRSSNARQT